MWLILTIAGQGFVTSKAVAQVRVPPLIQPLNIKEIECIGNTVFSDSELEAILASYKGQNISLELLERIKQDIDAHYLNQGYVSSGSFLPSQELQDGTIRIQIVEGTLAAIEIEGLSRLSDNYVIARLPEINKPLNINALAQSLTTLQNDPLIKQINGEITQQSLGQNVLLVNLEENPPFTATLRINNAYAPSVGRFGGVFNITHNNFLGLGDRLKLNNSQTEGLRRTGVSYSFPINRLDGRVFLGYNNADSENIEEDFKDLNIRADYNAFEFNFKQPVISTASDQLTLGIGIELTNSGTFILDDLSFAFTEGLEDGESRIRTLFLSQEYVKNGANSLLAARSQFNLGLDIFNATKTDVGIDGIYWAWQGDLQYLFSLDKRRNKVLVTRIAAQLTPDKLLPIKQLTIGGYGTVRGYARNIGVADNGVFGSVEFQYRLFRGKWGSISIIPFVDGGTIWNNSRDPIGSNTFASVGAALRCQLGEIFEVRLDYGIPLIEAEGFGATDTEDRLTFSVFMPLLRF